SLGDTTGTAYSSARDERERAGILVLEPPPAQLNTLTIALHNHGITATTRDGRVRLSAHAVLSVETVDMLRGAFTSYATAAIY
ncbi:hypothetical protein QN416_24105, partial [Glaciimonas sp. Cout2]|uniref:hypothetical protein n=1 Tax=Glaciimonas sp. Cout2 TaxID=3048621 RepID=UPI002B234770